MVGTILDLNKLALSSALCAVVVACLGASSAHAQPRPSVIVLQTHLGGGVDAASGSRASRALRLRLQQMSHFEVSADTDLALEDLQLAVGCVGESVDCLSSVAEQIGVQVLIVPSVSQVGERLIFGLTVFRTEGDSPMTSVTRRVPVAAGASALLAAASSALDEVFGEDARGEVAASEVQPTPPPPVVRAPQPAPATSTPRPEPARVQPRLPAENSSEPAQPRSIGWTWVASVGGAGAGMLVLGGVMGLASGSSESRYNRAQPTTTDDVDRALALRSKARRQARTANTFFVLGTAAVMTAVVLAVVGRGRSQEREPRLSFEPRVGPHSLALGLRVRMP